MSTKPPPDRPLTREELNELSRALSDAADEAKANRIDLLPDERACLAMLHKVVIRLRELGWRDVSDAPYAGDIEDVEVIEVGSTGIHPACRTERRWLVAEGGDAYCSTPLMYRPRKGAFPGERDTSRTLPPTLAARLRRRPGPVASPPREHQRARPDG